MHLLFFFTNVNLSFSVGNSFTGPPWPKLFKVKVNLEISLNAAEYPQNSSYNLNSVNVLHYIKKLDSVLLLPCAQDILV